MALGEVLKVVVQQILAMRAMPSLAPREKFLHHKIYFAPKERGAGPEGYIFTNPGSCTLILVVTLWARTKKWCKEKFRGRHAPIFQCQIGAKT